MYRKQEKDLQHWWAKPQRKPLVIRGARQVGKSTLVRNFCKQQNLQLFEINLEKHLSLNEVFALKRPKAVLDALEDILNIKIKNPSNCLIFFDEIQATPMAIPCLRYFFEEHSDLAIVCAGSLLEFTLNDHEYSMPVGRIEYLHMGPMSFHEFLLAKNENFLLERLENLREFKPFSLALHEQANELLRQYLFVGGMPEAIKTFVELGTEAVPEVQAQILQTYQDDFVKYVKKKDLQKIQKVFRYLFLNPCRKIKYSNISKDDLARELKACLQLLVLAKVATPIVHSTCNGLPIQASEDPKVLKMLGLDIGLVNHAQGLQWTAFKKYGENEILTEGVIAEHFVGQHLLHQRPSYLAPHLNYWLREGKTQNAEVDYVFEHNAHLVAIEVKAGASGKIRSLIQWMTDCKYKKKKALRFNLSPGELTQVSQHRDEQKTQFELLTLPLYMIEIWQRLIE